MGINYLSFEISLEPLTPVHVWNGMNLIYGLDAIELGNKLCIIDEEKIDISNYATDILEDRISLEKLIMKLVKEHKIICKYEIPINIRGKPGKMSEIKLLNPLIIPGSSLKGYFRTAFLMHILAGMLKRNKKNVINILNNYINLQHDPRYASTELEKFLMRTERLRYQGGFIDSFYKLQVSDPLMKHNISRSIQELHIYDYLGNQVSQSFIEIWSNGVLFYKIGIAKSISINSAKAFGLREKEHAREIQYFINMVNQVFKDKNSFINIIRKYSEEILEHEIKKVNKFKKNLSNKGIRLDNYIDLLDNLRNSIDKTPYCTPIRIGMFTDYRSKTIDSFIEKVDEQLMINIRRYMSEHYGRVWDDQSIKLVFFKGTYYGLGWIKLCLKD